MLLLLIGESLGMQELILIGVIALIIFGPRKLPQIARTIGKTMAEFRKATNEFKSTWEKEVDFERLDADEPVVTPNTIAKESPIQLPEIKALEESDYGKMSITATSPAAAEEVAAAEIEPDEEQQKGKRDWL